MLVAAATLAAGAALGWAALVNKQGDSQVSYDAEDLSGLHGDARTLHAEVTLRNQGKAGAVVHKVLGRIVEGPPGRVLVTRGGSRPPQRGWWQSNCLLPGETCVAEVDIELDEPATAPLTIELDVHDIGRRLVVHRRAQFMVDVPSLVTP